MVIDANPLLTLPEAAEILRTSANAVRLMIQRGKIPGVVRLGRRVLIRRVELYAHLGLPI